MTETSSRWKVMAGAATVFILAFAWRVLSFSGFQNDHYVHLARAQQLLLGDVPIRDFVDPGMPLMYLVSAAAWLLWGGAPGTELFLIAAAFALGALCIFVVAQRLSGSMAVAIAAALLGTLIAPRTYSYPKILLYAAAAWAILAVIDSPSRRRVLLLAALVAVAFLFRHDHGLYIGVAGAIAVALATRGLGWRTAAQRLAILVAGAAVLVSPWLALVAYHQGLVEYVESGITFSRTEAARNGGSLSFPGFELSPGEGLILLRPPHRPSAIVEWKPETPDDVRRTLEAKYGLEPVPTTDTRPREYYSRNSSPIAMRGLADDPHVADVSGLDRFVEWSAGDALLARVSPSRVHAGTGWHVDDNAYVWLFYVFHLLPIACAVLVWRSRGSDAERWRGETIAVVSLSLLAVLVNVGLLRGNLRVWLPDAVAPAVMLGAWFVPCAWNIASPRRAVRLATRAAVTVGLVATVVAVALAGDLNAQVERSGARAGVAGIAERVVNLQSRLWGTHADAGMPPSGVSEALLPFFKYLQRCTSPDDRLMMTQLYPDVFVMAQRGFAGGHVAFMEAFYSSPADQEQTLARLRRESVPFILILQNREDVFRGSFDRLAPYIDERYEPMASVPVEQTDAVRVLVEKERPTARIDEETGWACFT